MKKCPMCAEDVQDDAIICKHCRYNFEKEQMEGEKKGATYSKTTAGLLALFLGGIGIHKFYLNRPLQGFFYLIFCWTFVPAIIGFFEAISYFSYSDDEKFTEKMKHK